MSHIHMIHIKETVMSYKTVYRPYEKQGIVQYFLQVKKYPATDIILIIYVLVTNPIVLIITWQKFVKRWVLEDNGLLNCKYD